MTDEAAKPLKNSLILHGMVAATWDEEIVGRMEDLDSGTVKPVSLAEAQRRLSSAVE
jgi:hypothetical protein